MFSYKLFHLLCDNYKISILATVKKKKKKKKGEHIRTAYINAQRSISLALENVILYWAHLSKIQHIQIAHDFNLIERQVKIWPKLVK